MSYVPICCGGSFITEMTTSEKQLSSLERLKTENKEDELYEMHKINRCQIVNLYFVIGVLTLH